MFHTLNNRAKKAAGLWTEAHSPKLHGKLRRQRTHHTKNKTKTNAYQACAKTLHTLSLVYRQLGRIIT